MTVAALKKAARSLIDDLADVRIPAPVTHTYNPLVYAWAMHAAYLTDYGNGKKKVLFLGMNPGPFGMAQTGVPFGEIAAVRDYLGLRAKVTKPDPEHPKRPVDGLDCPRSEVSGRRLWGLFQARFPKPTAFFRHHFVANWCPLAFMEASGRNVTPDQLPKAVQKQIQGACDAHLRRLVEILQPVWLVGVGKFAEAAGERLAIPQLKVATIPHPSPANPAANKDWAGAATKALTSAGVW